jgi:predicted neuraminidase
VKKALVVCLLGGLAGALFSAEPTAHRAGIILEEFVYTEADFPQCHASTILELEGGELLCAFFGGTKESHPDVESRLSRKAPGGEWTPPVSIADGVQPDGTRYATGNPVLFQPRGGDVMLFYKVFKPRERWWGEVKTSSDGGRTWSQAQRISPDRVGPDKNKPVQLADGSILAPSALEDSPGWRVQVESSIDGGKSWSIVGPLNDPEEFKVIQPTILTHADGRLQMLMRNGRSDDDTRIPQTWSSDGGLTWSPVSNTSLPNNNSGLDGVSLDDGRHLLVYNHSTRLQPGMGHKGRGVLNVAVSEDGVNWEAALVLEHYDEPGKQFSYPAVIQARDGLVHIVYTWHRRRIKHVVLDPTQLVTFPIENGRWPTEHVPIAPVTAASTAELVAAGL